MPTYHQPSHHVNAPNQDAPGGGGAWGTGMPTTAGPYSS
jgi:hypothetical protein